MCGRRTCLDRCEVSPVGDNRIHGSDTEVNQRPMQSYHRERVHLAVLPWAFFVSLAIGGRVLPDSHQDE